MRIDELRGSTPYPYVWSNHTSAVFDISEKYCKVNFFEISPEKYDVSFSMFKKGVNKKYGNVGITGESGLGASKVFATVITIIKEFIKNNDVISLEFAADVKEQSRIKLYNSLIRWFGEETINGHRYRVRRYSGPVRTPYYVFYSIERIPDNETL